MTQLTAALASAPPAALFQGYNSVLGSGLSTAVEGDAVDGGARSEVKCSVSMTAEELAQSLEIDQSLSVGFGPLGGVEEKMKFFTSLKVTTYSVSVTVFARHSTGSRTMTDVRVKAGVVPPKTTADLNQFVRFYGDSFLSSVTLGGEYYGVYTFYSQTREEQSSLVSSLHASGIFDGVTVGGSLQVAMNNFLKTTTIRYKFEQAVSGIKNPALPEPANFISYALKFPSLSLDAPVMVGMSTTGYESVRGIGEVFLPVARNREYFVGNSLAGGLAGKLVAITQIQNQMNWVKAIYDSYGGYADSVLTARLPVAKADIDAIHKQMGIYSETPTATFTEPDLKSLQTGTPALNYSVGTTSAWGGGGGGPFSDVDINAYIQNETHISALKLRTGSRVDQLNTTYRNNRGSWTQTHGGGGGGEGNTLQLQPGQFVTRVWGRSGSRVDQLNFQISDGRTVGGGGGGGGEFSWSTPGGNFVLGFQGRSGSELDCIQVVYAHFNPANWLPVAVD